MHNRFRVSVDARCDRNILDVMEWPLYNIYIYVGVGRTGCVNMMAMLIEFTIATARLIPVGVDDTILITSV